MSGSTIYNSLEELWITLEKNEDSSYLLEDLKPRVEGLVERPLNVSWVSTETDYAIANSLGILIEGKELDTWESSVGEEVYKSIEINSDYGNTLIIEINIPGMSDYLVITF